MTLSAIEFQARFASPDTACRPMLRWWWPGGAVDEGALIAQLRGFQAAGFGGVEVQPFRIGLPADLPAAVRARVHEVFTPPFFALLGAVMAEAERLGLVVDLNFGSAWPFGGAAITPELAATELTLAWTSVPGGQHWSGRPLQPTQPLRAATYFARHGHGDPAQALPAGWAERIAQRERVVAVLGLRGGVPSCAPFPGFVPMTLPDAWGEVLGAGWVDAEATVDLTDRLGPDGRLQWDVPPGRWQIMVVKQFVLDVTIGEAAGRGPQRVMSHLDRAAFEALAEGLFGEGFARLQRHAGRAWRAVFVDSLELPADIHWCDDFAAEFQRRRGYALRPWLPLLVQPGWCNGFQPRRGAPLFDDARHGERVRADYRRTVSELMVERCYAPFADWAAARGLQSRVQAHGSPTDWLAAYGTASMPETEDLMGGAGAHFLRVARSAAHQHGRPLVSAEAFVWLVEGLAVTPQQMRERADELLVAGVQQIVGHGASAGIALGDGRTQRWYPWQALEIGTMLDAHNPVFALLRPFTDYLGRLQAVLRRGRACVPVAVLAPPDLFAFDGAGARLTPPAWHGALQDAGHDWDWINGDALCSLPLVDGALATPAGPAHRAVLLPALPALDAAVAQRLVDIAEAGVAVLAIERWPERGTGLHDAACTDALVQGCVARLRRQAWVGAGAAIAPSRIGAALSAAGVAPAWPFALPAGARFTRRDDDGGLCWGLLHNPGEAPMSVPVPHRGVQRWDAWTGEAEATGPSLTLAPRSAMLLQWVADPVSDLLTHEVRGRHQAAAAAPADAAATGRALDGLSWQLRAEGQGLGGRPIALRCPIDIGSDLAELPGLADFAGLLHCEAVLDGDPALPDAVLELGAIAGAAQVQVDDRPPAMLTEAPFTLHVGTALASPGPHRLRITLATLPENAWRDPARPGGLPLPGRRLTRLPCGLPGPVTLRARAPAERCRWRLPTDATSTAPAAPAASTPTRPSLHTPTPEGLS